MLSIDECNDNPLYRAIGLRLLSMEDGRGRSELNPTPAVCWPFEGQPHGGILFTVMDTTMAFGIISALRYTTSCATISLNIQYTRRAQAPPFVCTTTTSHTTRNVAFCSAEIHDCHGELVAMGQGSFKLLTKKNQ